MSYGHNPWYIYSDGEKMHFHPTDGAAGSPLDATVVIPLQALYQLVAHLTSRGTKTLQDWIDWGMEQSPEDIPEDLTVKVYNSWAVEEKPEYVNVVELGD